MPITFKSEARASVEMIEANAKELLELLGKNPSGARGVFTEEQIPSAIDVLRAVITARAGQRKSLAIAEIDEKAGEVFEVDISSRAMPLLELFEYAQIAKKPVTWGNLDARFAQRVIKPVLPSVSFPICGVEQAHPLQRHGVLAVFRGGRV